jgi:RimJ/RimL family protein N-acetyltransferase
VVIVGMGPVTLREVEEDDLAALYEHQREPEALRMGSLRTRERDAFMTHWTTTILGNASVTKRTILVDGCVAGNVVSFGRDGRRLVGYWLGREFWGKGVATAALFEFLKHERERPLFAFVAKQNLGSIRVLEKCGFTIDEQHAEASRLPDDGVEEHLMRLVGASGEASERDRT